MYNLELNSKTKERVSYGQARPINNFIKAVVVSEIGESSENPYCTFTNGVNIVSNKTFQTSKNFLDSPQISKWILLLPAVDSVSD